MRKVILRKKGISQTHPPPDEKAIQEAQGVKRSELTTTERGFQVVALHYKDEILANQKKEGMLVKRKG